jgi:hypothetical protein
MPTVGTLYFGPFNPFHYYPLPLYLQPLHFQQILIHIFISSTLTDLMLYHSLFPTSFPKFHGVVPLFQACSTSEFVYNLGNQVSTTTMESTVEIPHKAKDTIAI